jgi:hypothetical protein
MKYIYYVAPPPTNNKLNDEDNTMLDRIKVCGKVDISDLFKDEIPEIIKSPNYKKKIVTFNDKVSATFLLTKNISNINHIVSILRKLYKYDCIRIDEV